MVVPRRRDVKRGTVGNDAYAVKRMLKRKGFGLGLALGNNRYGRTFGPVAVLRLKQFQRKHKLAADGVYGAATHRKAIRGGGFDAYGRFLMASIKVPSEAATRRATIVAAALLGARNRDAIHYTQTYRRMQGVRERLRPPRFPVYEDCSSFATWCYWVAGAPDPNGRGYDGAGYTGTQTSHGRRVGLTEHLLPGDLVFYGNPIGHVAIYIGGGKVVSHGSEGGPYVLPIAYRPITQVRRYF